MDVENSIAPVRSKSGHDSPPERNGLSGGKSGPVRYESGPVRYKSGPVRYESGPLRALHFGAYCIYMYKRLLWVKVTHDLC